MVSNSSSPVGGQSVFSFDSQPEVMLLLASVRQSQLSTAEKNELRDLIFLYTNGGGDPSVRITLEQKIASHNLKPVAMKVVQSSQPKKELPTIGNFRAAPSFAIKVTEESVKEVPEPVAQKQVPVIEEIKVTPTPVAVNIPVEPAPAEKVPDEVFNSTEESLERIRKIKSLVNEQVGNPVNLVELNPDVGREYMSSLLDAMKKINSGSSAVAAMARLEESYEAVIEVIKNSSVPKAPPVQSAPMPEPVAPPQPPAAAVPAVHIANLSEVSNRARVIADEEREAPVDPVPVAPVPHQVPVKVAPVVAETPSYVETAQREESAAPVDSVPEPVNINRVPVNNAGRQVNERSSNVPIMSTPRTTFATDGHDEVLNPSPRDVMPAGTAAVPNAAPISPLSSLSSPLIKGPKSMEVSPEASAKSEDPLQSSDVDSGLQQLLEEWPLFQKSGLFGTGPKGREHPLFKRISSLQIPLLLAGRFEGATQEIKQSITDYMNGWRYEQGLIYEQGETFEHYLRRVIRHILDLQRNKV